MTWHCVADGITSFLTVLASPRADIKGKIPGTLVFGEFFIFWWGERGEWDVGSKGFFEVIVGCYGFFFFFKPSLLWYLFIV